MRGPRLFGLLILSVLLAACSAPGAPPTPTIAPPPTDTPAPTNAPAPIAAPATAPAAEPTAAAEAIPEGSSIVVTHAAGELTLDAPAARIVACSEEAIDFLITLNIKPIGICSDRVTGGTSGAPFEIPHFFPKEALGEPVFLGTASSPSLEQITLLKPDLILAGVWAESANKQLAEIAPTFIIDTAVPGYWRDTLIEIGRAVGREEQAQQFLTDYEATAARLAGELVPIAERSPNVLFIYSFAATDGTMLLGPGWTGSRPFELLGFTVLEPEGFDLSNGGVAPISPEMPGEIDADFVFVIRIKTPDGEVPRYPIDEILDSLKGPTVIYQLVDSTRGSTAPYTDLFVLEEIARLLREAPQA